MRLQEMLNYAGDVIMWSVLGGCIATMITLMVR